MTKNQNQDPAATPRMLFIGLDVNETSSPAEHAAVFKLITERNQGQQSAIPANLSITASANPHRISTREKANHEPFHRH